MAAKKTKPKKDLAEKLLEFVDKTLKENTAEIVGYEIVRGPDGYVIFKVTTDLVTITGEDGKLYPILSAKYHDGVEKDRGGYEDLVENYLSAKERLSKALGNQ